MIENVLRETGFFMIEKHTFYKNIIRLNTKYVKRENTDKLI